MKVAIDILKFIGIPDNEVLNLYYKLISSDVYGSQSKIKVTISNQK